MRGTPTAPARGGLRRAAVSALVSVPLLCALLPAGTATAASPDARPQTRPQAAAQEAVRTAGAARQDARQQTGAQLTAQKRQNAPTGSRTTEISLDRLTPSVPGKGDTLTVSGTVTNKSDRAVSSGEIGLRVGPAMNSRSAIDEVARRKGYAPGADGTAVDGHRAKTALLPAGVSRKFSMKVPVGDLDLGGSGVYQLSVTLTAHTKAQPYDQVMGVERTFLPWRTSASSPKTKLTYLWPLVSTSHLTARTESDEQQTSVFRDDDLAEAIGPGGRLQQMVELGADLPVTWVVDPDLLASVDAMTKSYEVRTGDEGEPGKGQAAARQWLKDLQDAVRGKKVVALPFADPDLASLAHRGRAVPGALSRLRPATELASDTVEVILHTKPSTDFAWPYEGALDSSVVQVATSGGAHHVIGRSDSFQESGGVPYTPTAARPIGGGTTAVVADHRLSTAFDRDLSGAGASTQAVQQFLAETLAIADQVPNQQRSIVVAPQRMPTGSQVRAMAQAVEALSGGGGWTQAVDLTEAAKAKPDPAARRTVPGGGEYPRALRGQELPTSAFEQIQRTQLKLADFSEILSRKDRVMPPFGNAIDREISNSWRGERTDAANFRASVQSYLDDLTEEVGLIPKSDLTLSGRSATIPVTVQNNLRQDVNGLVLRLTSSRTIGLEVGDEQPVVVTGGHSQSVKFGSTAKANGLTTVTAQLYTKEGKPYGPPMTFQVKVTSITSTVLLVIAVGVLLVVLAGIRMYTQRKRRSAAEDAAEDATAEAGAETGTAPEAPEAADTRPEPDADATGSVGAAPAAGSVREPNTPSEPSSSPSEVSGHPPEHPGERGADTSGESSGPRDTGEKVDR
ncbi:DUF6049 family protein [Streptomyces phytohabitans]|uniref:DUF6049 family protein n=1 Tax=Streptomyces phytohabitans TaxID=1150371 RepID=UPI00345C2B67